MEQFPDGSVIITPNEMFRELRDTHDEVKALGSQIGALTQNVSHRVDELERAVARNQGRLEALERWRWMLAGAATAAGAVGAAAVDYLLK